MVPEHYDVIVVGTGFAGSFFLQRFLERNRTVKKVLVLERGSHDNHAWQISHRKNARLDSETLFVNQTPKKSWLFTSALGGGSNCWWACTPRLLPSDFQLHRLYGVGRDWPLSYDDLEPFYADAERIMSVSGADEQTLFRRSSAYPQAAHRFSAVDRAFKKQFGPLFNQQPCSRNRVPTANRPACCGAGHCHLCPTDVKFTVMNEMSSLYDDARVRLSLESEAVAIDHQGDIAKGVTYRKKGGLFSATGDLIVLAANALFNPFILMKSGMSHPALGTGLHEQAALSVRADLDGIDNFGGSTSITGHGYMLYDGEHRKDHAGCLLEVYNVPTLRLEKGKWRQRVEMKFILEDLPKSHNFVGISPNDPHKPLVTFQGHSDYLMKGLKQLREKIPRLLAFLPIERLHIADSLSDTEGHILGTAVMGREARSSVVDPFQIHHRYRNLLVLGSSSFPVSGPANPTLTICALSLRTAHHLTS